MHMHTGKLFFFSLAAGFTAICGFCWFFKRQSNILFEITGQIWEKRVNWNVKVESSSLLSGLYV